ncbi:DUF177 domain-containing protein [Roseibacterium sp. SDUM158017]|uniref:YceD family protein n=1 Tax=Roseicyclus salinarum TaxID=3036773 RepID=UPI0024153FD8|nr:DUF177 domain-containing protein [Roseibacterium sp. SDUM158017]MDG4648060.1 DUF177 domain-containing protein [Roseibacterium sp. SDUM158017]
MTTPKSQGTPGHVVPLARQTRLDLDFSIVPETEARRAAAETLGIEAVRKLRFEGTLHPVGARDWHLEARLGATVVQPCVVTLAPVTTRIDTELERRYLADFVEPEGDEAEMPQDDTAEALPERLDLSAVMLEALALALPDYPRAEGAELGEANFAEPGVAPMTDEDARPLAGLAALRDRLRGEDEDDSDA